MFCAGILLGLGWRVTFILASPHWMYPVFLGGTKRVEVMGQLEVRLKNTILIAYYSTLFKYYFLGGVRS